MVGQSDLTKTPLGVSGLPDNAQSFAAGVTQDVAPSASLKAESQGITSTGIDNPLEGVTESLNALGSTLQREEAAEQSEVLEQEQAEISSEMMKKVQAYRIETLPKEGEYDKQLRKITENANQTVATYPSKLFAKDRGAIETDGKVTSSQIVYANQGATRNLRVVPQLEKAIATNVASVFGNEYKVEIISGGQDPSGKTVGSDRHNHGNAADVFIINTKTGKRVTGDALIPFAEKWLGSGIGSVGFPSRTSQSLHLDLKGGEGEGSQPLGRGQGRVWFYGQPNELQSSLKTRFG